VTAYLHVITPAEVVDARTFAEYAQQTLGTPIPSGREIAVLQRKANDFFKSSPQATWGTLARTVEWCRAKKRRPALAWGVIAQVRWAWSDGILPELDPRAAVNSTVEYQIEQILETETEERWRDRLVGACGVSGRSGALASYRRAHA
jgi:hypothetical protein